MDKKQNRERARENSQALIDKHGDGSGTVYTPAGIPRGTNPKDWNGFTPDEATEDPASTRQAVARDIFLMKLWAMIGLILCTVAITIASLGLAGLLR